MQSHHDVRSFYTTMKERHKSRKETGKKTEKNSVTRFKSIAGNNKIKQSYDSLVSGIRIKSVPEKKSLSILNEYFDKVRKTNNYIFLTNLEYDESSNLNYDIIIRQSASVRL